MQSSSDDSMLDSSRPNPMTDILRREEKCRHRHTGRMPCDRRSRDWSDVMTSQGIPRIAGNHQKLEETGKHPSLRAFRETMALLLISEF